MAPVLTLRNYSKLVSDYLTTLFKIHAQKVEDCAKSEKIRVATTGQFFKMFDAVLMNPATGSGNLSRDSMNQLLKAYQTFKVSCDPYLIILEYALYLTSHGFSELP